jgi:hypothetical protein
MVAYETRSLIVAAIALLAATAAEARPVHSFHCGKVDITAVPAKYLGGEQGGWYYKLQDLDRKNRLPDRHFRFISTDGGEVWMLYKGKRCRRFTPDEDDKDWR